MMLPEIEHYLASLDEVRRQAAAIIQGVPAEGLNWRPSLPADADLTNSLGVLAVHIAGSEHFWIAETIGGYPITRVRDEEFKYVATSDEEPLKRLHDVGLETHLVLEKFTAEKLDSSFMKDDREVPVRWAIHHVLYHSSLHVGHMQLTFQLWNKGMATGNVRWFDRLKK